MCGRYAITTAPQAMRRLFAYANEPDFPPRYNISPTQPIPIVRLVDGRRELALVRWGLIPSWVKDPRAFSLLFNARGDGVLDKPAFRAAMRRRRCLVPADGFYEWRQDGARKRPYYVRLRDGGPMAFAGLWETWMGPNGEELESAVIVTTEANRLLRPIHERMPVIVPPEAFDLWLDCTRADAEMAAALLIPASEALLEVYEVSPAVSRAANDSPDLIAPLSTLQPAITPARAPARKPAARARRDKKKEDDGQTSLL
ncbi:MAG TPA: SOS response-associated peptidase [Xanthobacteraceae bacterium]|nr:SOS response-associated peptidase [Xanthobacteraceae bacterium]